MERRRDPRTRLDLTVRVRRWKREIQLACVDASYRGLRLVGDPLRAHEQELIELHINPGGGDLRFFGKVVCNDNGVVCVELLHSDAVTRASWERTVRAMLNNQSFNEALAGA